MGGKGKRGACVSWPATAAVRVFVNAVGLPGSCATQGKVPTVVAVVVEPLSLEEKQARIVLPTSVPPILPEEVSVSEEARGREGTGVALA